MRLYGHWGILNYSQMARAAELVSVFILVIYSAHSILFILQKSRNNMKIKIELLAIWESHVWP